MMPCSGELGADGGSIDGGSIDGGSIDGLSIDCDCCHESTGAAAGESMAGGTGVAGEAVTVAAAAFFAARRAFSDASLHSRKLMPSGLLLLLRSIVRS